MLVSANEWFFEILTLVTFSRSIFSNPNLSLKSPLPSLPLDPIPHENISPLVVVTTEWFLDNAIWVYLGLRKVFCIDGDVFLELGV